MTNIDIVITWVDGADPILAAKREHYLTNASAPLHDNGTNPHRWVCSDELKYCLHSIGKNAPWVRRIWIVTDEQIPDLWDINAALLEKITVVDHREIFDGFADALPTFNSLSIETMLWRIPGLAEYFLYFNDDVFLTAPVKPDDFFTQNGPLLRGKWADYGHLPECDDSRDAASMLNHYNQINAANMIGYSANHIFASAHVVHPMQRSVMAALFDNHRDEFIRNAGHHFRCTQQFLPQSLYNHACLKNGTAMVHDACDYLHVPIGAFDKWPVDEVESYLNKAKQDDMKFICINDLPDVERYFPEFRSWIMDVIG
jgi:hypothetical protein